MEELIAWILVIAAVVIVLPFIIHWVIAGLYCFLAAVGWGSYFTLDQFFNAAFIPSAPWVMWMIAGGMIGAALGFWTLAPVYGLRRYRLLIVLAPFFLTTVIMMIRLLVTRGS